MSTGSGNAPLLSVLLEEMVSNERVVAALEQAAGRPVILKATNGKAAIDLSWLFELLEKLSPFLGKLGPLLPAIIPILLTLFSGGALSPATLAALIPILLRIFGVSTTEAQKMLSEAAPTP